MSHVVCSSTLNYETWRKENFDRQGQEGGQAVGVQRGALGLTLMFCLYLFRSSLCYLFFAWLHSSCGMAQQPVELSGKLVTKPCVRPSAPLCTFSSPFQMEIHALRGNRINNPKSMKLET